MELNFLYCDVKVVCLTQNNFDSKQKLHVLIESLSWQIRGLGRGFGKSSPF